MNRMDPHEDLIWRVRSVEPVTALQVTGVFAGFVALAHFVFQSPEAVNALLAAGVGSVVALIPNILARMEYRLTESGLVKRRVKAKEPADFKDVFKWDELSHVVPTKSGFKFYKRLDSSSWLHRFLKVHLLGDHSGEFNVGPGDLDRVRGIIAQRGIPISEFRLPRRIEPKPRA